MIGIYVTNTNDLKMKLKDELKKFATTFGRDGKDIGEIIVNDNVDETDSFEFFYKTLLFDKVLTIYGELFINIFSFSELSKAQEGWSKIRTTTGEWIDDEKKWKKEWVVFAERNGDAIFYNELDKCIYGTINKNEFFKLSNSLSLFFYVITECMILEDRKYQFNTYDEDEETLQEFINDVLGILNNCANKENKDDFIQFFFD